MSISNSELDYVRELLHEQRAIPAVIVEAILVRLAVAESVENREHSFDSSKLAQPSNVCLQLIGSFEHSALSAE
jgi:hypothetical protein